ncbi:DUF3375 domain-containing protein [Wenzhouxiangella sp. C33]|uniref:DUF3375 domain-containing protein n=1 Tax=Wenzhouxiangella limi TaxID=2707351 RepID=A0A845V3R8_9GAMM|nr:DUF3375 domain-containing protein [Wenzhouxiangella limi]
MDFDTLSALRETHGGWRLLVADSAPMVTSFFYRTFIESNSRAMAEGELVTRLDDHLTAIREVHGEDSYPRPALAYLKDWSDDQRAWMRRYYVSDSDEAHYDLTPAAEAAIRWLAGLEQPSFVGAESRLLTVFDLLQQIVRGTETDPAARIAELEARRASIDAEIERIRAGELSLMDDTRLKERFLQMADTARALLADFRQVEHNFRHLDRQVRERITWFEGGKGEVLEEVFGEQDAIADSDQGRSFRAFWDFLMSPARQEELSGLLERIFELEAVIELKPDRRLKRVHYDWLEAGEVTQRTVARLSQQLRRFLDDQAWLENRRIMELIRSLERKAVAVRETPPRQLGMQLDMPVPALNLVMDRPLFSPPLRPEILADVRLADDSLIDAQALFEQVHVDRLALEAAIRRALQQRDQISLAELLEQRPLTQGLAELVTYLAIAAEDGAGLIDDSTIQTVAWTQADGRQRQARVPLVLFSR